MQKFWLLNNGGIFLSIMLVNLMNALFEPPLPVFVVAYIAVMGLLALALQHRPARAVRADERGLTLPSRRHKHIPWSQVQDLRRKSRYEPGAILVLTSGEQREVLGPDLDVLTEWWHLAVPADRRPATAAD